MKWMNCLLCRAVVFVAIASGSLSRTVQPVTYSYQITNGEETYTLPYYRYGIGPDTQDRQTSVTIDNDSVSSHDATASSSVHPSLLAHHYYDHSLGPSKIVSSHLRNVTKKQLGLETAKILKPKKIDYTNTRRTATADFETTTVTYSTNTKMKLTETEPPMRIRKIRIWKKVGPLKTSRSQIPVNEEVSSNPVTSIADHISNEKDDRRPHGNRNTHDQLKNNKTGSFNVHKMRINQILVENSEPTFAGFPRTSTSTVRNEAEIVRRTEQTNDNRRLKTVNVNVKLVTDPSPLNEPMFEINENSLLPRAKNKGMLENIIEGKSSVKRQKNSKINAQANDNDTTYVKKPSSLMRIVNSKNYSEQNTLSEMDEQPPFLSSDRNEMNVTLERYKVADFDIDNNNDDDIEDDTETENLNGNSTDVQYKIMRNDKTVTPLPKYKELYFKRPTKKGQDRLSDSPMNPLKAEQLNVNSYQRGKNERARYTTERSSTLKTDLNLSYTENEDEKEGAATAEIKNESNYEPNTHRHLFKYTDSQKTDTKRERTHIVEEPSDEEEYEQRYQPDDKFIISEEGNGAGKGENDGSIFKEGKAKIRKGVHSLKTLQKPLQYAYLPDQSPQSSSNGGGHKQLEANKNKDDGEKHKSVQQESQAHNANKGYHSDYEYEKAKKGHSDKESRIRDHHEAEGKKKKHQEEGGHYGDQHMQAEGKKEAEFGESGNHKKGHSTKGSHNVHKKNEFLKKYEFYDEHHEDDDHKKYGHFHKGHGYDKGGNYKKMYKDKDYSHNDQGKKGEKHEGRNEHENRGHNDESGRKTHGEHNRYYGNKDGYIKSDVWLFENL